MRSLTRSRLFWGSLAALAIAAAFPLVGGSYAIGVLIPAFYFAVFAMSWDLLFGFAGEVNFGPTFLIGLGAYGAGIVDARYNIGIPLSVAFGTLVAVVGGVLLALPALAVSLTFGMLRFPNFAIGSTLTLGAYAGWVFNVPLGLPLAGC